MIKKRALLSRLIDPFVLRRKKGDVLNDLPEKIEDCVLLLSEDQQKMYSDVVSKGKDALIRDISNQIRLSLICMSLLFSIR